MFFQRVFLGRTGFSTSKDDRRNWEMIGRFISGFLILLSVATGQDVGVPDYLVEHPECPLFGPKYNKLVSNAVNLQGLTSHRTAMSALTSQVVAQLGFVPGGSRTDTFSKLAQGSV